MVDKFQGQTCAAVIYSMATSSPEYAPRGMEFLYSLNRLNVVTSRGRCALGTLEEMMLINLVQGGGGVSGIQENYAAQE
jgi:uncharacterized protein